MVLGGLDEGDTKRVFNKAAIGGEMACNITRKPTNLLIQSDFFHFERVESEVVVTTLYNCGIAGGALRPFRDTRPLPQGLSQLSSLRSTCGSGLVSRWAAKRPRQS
ncbi:hypothetical protein D3C80_1756940 [compost metagenome]